MTDSPSAESAAKVARAYKQLAGIYGPTVHTEAARFLDDLYETAARRSTSQLPADLADMRAKATANLTDFGIILRSAQVVNNRLAAVEKRQDRLEQSQSQLAAGSERQAEPAAARHRAHALLATTTPELRAERPLIPPEARPWNSPRPPITP
uniref:hypothetical protein n=1 Tax=Kitasatospora sp. NBC_01519 TaxID=2903576 RepID=UPI002F908143